MKNGIIKQEKNNEKVKSKIEKENKKIESVLEPDETYEFEYDEFLEDE